MNFFQSCLHFAAFKNVYEVQRAHMILVLKKGICNAQRKYLCAGIIDVLFSAVGPNYMGNRFCSHRTLIRNTYLKWVLGNLVVKTTPRIERRTLMHLFIYLKRNVSQKSSHIYNRDSSIFLIISQ